MPPPYTQHEVMVYLTGPRAVAVRETDFAKANADMVTEQNLIRDDKFVYEHHTDRLQTIGAEHKFFAKLTASAGIAQPASREIATTRYWYRAMTRPEFRYLKKNGNVMLWDSYVGMCTWANYSKDEYMGWAKEHDYLVQFTCHGTTNFQTELEATRADPERYKQWPELKDKRWGVAVQPKAEAESGTYGLGSTGQYSGLTGKVFNKLLDESRITWDLVHFIVRAK
ncbi:MAG TPA: hypothetical protein VIP05_05865 [Burkholderiaceae bacterium]